MRAVQIIKNSLWENELTFRAVAVGAWIRDKTDWILCQDQI